MLKNLSEEQYKLYLVESAAPIFLSGRVNQNDRNQVVISQPEKVDACLKPPI